LAETQGRFDCAIVQYEQAVRLKSDHVPSLYRLGVVNTKLKQYDKAVAYWKRYIKATGDIASGYSNLGFCYEMARRVDDAEQAYKEGLQRDPNSVACRTNYGLMLARNNRVSEAEVQLSAVLKPDEVSYNIASIYEQQGAIAQAKQELKKALEINPANVEAQSKLAGMDNMPVD
jgi:tetratricopeptide (TPR) repeat protein